MCGTADAYVVGVGFVSICADMHILIRLCTTTFLKWLGCTRCAWVCALLEAVCVVALDTTHITRARLAKSDVRAALCERVDSADMCGPSENGDLSDCSNRPSAKLSDDRHRLINQATDFHADPSVVIQE